MKDTLHVNVCKQMLQNGSICRYIMMIENAYFSINPPTDQSLENRPKKSPLEEYVCKLIYLDLCKAKTEKVCPLCDQ